VYENTGQKKLTAGCMVQCCLIIGKKICF